MVGLWVSDGHCVLDIRVSGGDTRRFPALAEELIALGPDVLLESLADGVRRLRLPTIGAPRAGGLLYYQQDWVDSIRETADFVDRILRGAKPHELPVRQSNRYLLVVKKKLAREMNAVIPQSIRLRADSVID